MRRPPGSRVVTDPAAASEAYPDVPFWVPDGPGRWREPTLAEVMGAAELAAALTRARAAEAARLDALIERTADWLIQGRDGDDAEGTAASWAYLEQLRRQRAAIPQ